jgi:hypothetical protein
MTSDHKMNKHPQNQYQNKYYRLISPHTNRAASRHSEIAGKGKEYLDLI